MLYIHNIFSFLQPIDYQTLSAPNESNRIESNLNGSSCTASYEAVQKCRCWTGRPVITRSRYRSTKDRWMKKRVHRRLCCTESIHYF